MKRTLTLMAVFVMIISSASAAEITLNAKESFEVGEQIGFNYTLQGDQEVRYIPSISCPSAREPLLQVKTTDLTEGDFSSVYTYGAVTSDMEPQTCSANLRILTTNETKSQEIKIEGRPKFNASVNLCSSETCEEIKTVFTNQETPYITVESSKDPQIEALLVKPDGSREDLEPPKKLKNLEKGNYRVKVNASLDGYQRQQMEKSFAVIGESPEFDEENFSKGNTETSAGFLAKIWRIMTEWM